MKDKIIAILKSNFYREKGDLPIILVIADEILAVFNTEFDKWEQKDIELAKVEPEGGTAENYTKKINSMIKWGKDNVPQFEENELSDGYHTFNELYEFRKVFNACLFNEWASQDKYEVHKSRKHNNGELCFGGGWFIVVAILPDGQISNHYKENEWELFKIPAVEKALYEFDGHTPNDVIIRLNKAMESYASSKQIDLRKELKKFIDYLEAVKIYDSRYVIDNYLNNL